jgi:hypothetical protein
MVISSPASHYSALLIAGEMGDISRFPDSGSDHLLLRRPIPLDALIRREDVPRPDNQAGEQVPEVDTRPGDPR